MVAKITCLGNFAPSMRTKQYSHCKRVTKHLALHGPKCCLSLGGYSAHDWRESSHLRKIFSPDASSVRQQWFSVVCTECSASLISANVPASELWIWTSSLFSWYWRACYYSKHLVIHCSWYALKPFCFYYWLFTILVNCAVWNKSGLLV